jgi:hypothetical protein
MPIVSCSSAIMSYSTPKSGNLTAAQRCIAIPELASMIVRGRGYASSDYLRMALSCRAFMDPALDEMWAEDHSLVKLLALFPEGMVYKMNEAYQVRSTRAVWHDNSSNEYSLRRLLSARTGLGSSSTQSASFI